MFSCQKAKCGHTLRTIGCTYWFIEKAALFKTSIADLDPVQSGPIPFNWQIKIPTPFRARIFPRFHGGWTRPGSKSGSSPCPNNKCAYVVTWYCSHGLHYLHSGHLSNKKYIVLLYVIYMSFYTKSSVVMFKLGKSEAMISFCMSYRSIGFLR